MYPLLLTRASTVIAWVTSWFVFGSQQRSVPQSLRLVGARARSDWRRMVLHDHSFRALRAFPPQHRAHVRRRKNRRVRANPGAEFEPGKFVRKQTPNLRQWRTGAVAQRI